MKLVGMGNEPEDHRASVVLRTRMFKATYPEEELHNDTHCILAGATCVSVDPGNRLLFQDLSFTEVTSNFDPSWIYLTVESVNQRDIRPLVIEGIRVKSRAPKALEVVNPSV